MRDYYKATLDTVIGNLERSNPEWSGAIRKWRSFLARAAYLISETTGCDPEDALGDILESVTFVLDMYCGDLFKYNSRLYRLVGVIEGVATISAVRRVTRGREGDIQVPESDLDPVKRGKLDTMLYHCVYQQYANILRDNFTEKNGYLPVEEEMQLEVSGFGHGKKTLVRKMRTQHQRSISTHSLESASIVDSRNYLGDVSMDPEECVCVMDVIEGIESRLSDKDLQVFEMLLKDPAYTIREVRNSTGFSHHKVCSARSNIKKSFRDVTKGLYGNHEH